MDLEKAKAFTLNRLFLGDTILNWLLGFALLLLPGKIDSLLGSSLLFPPVFYTVVGAVFLAFAAWQTFVVVRKKELGIPALVFAAVMAEAPTVLLTIALIYLPLALKPGWRVVLWIADIYMFVLGCWYFHLVHRMVVEEEHSSKEPSQ
jgi:ABC-type transport system involved in cytochrome c biogenesis permease subunit